MLISKIISGGQTGVDRAALDFALDNMIPCGGWCPKGRIAEDGIIPKKYPLQETETKIYDERTEKNVLDADGTLIINNGKALFGGTKYTHEFCLLHNKPCIVIDISDKKDFGKEFENWISKYDIKTLNIAGPRKRTQPGIYQKAVEVLQQLLHC